MKASVTDEHRFTRIIKKFPIFRAMIYLCKSLFIRG